MDEAVLEKLRATRDPGEKAAIIAELVFNELPMEIALVARRCVILHWFDRSVVEALLQDTSLLNSETRQVYEQIASLPFVETLSWGLAFQNSTRDGLLKRYALEQTELLKTAAGLAAPSYEARQQDERIAAEALYCYLVAGDHSSSMRVLDALLERARSHKDSQHISILLRLQDEVAQLPLVQPLPQIWAKLRTYSTTSGQPSRLRKKARESLHTASEITQAQRDSSKQPKQVPQRNTQNMGEPARRNLIVHAIGFLSQFPLRIISLLILGLALIALSFVPFLTQTATLLSDLLRQFGTGLLIAGVASAFLWPLLVKSYSKSAEQQSGFLRQDIIGELRGVQENVVSRSEQLIHSSTSLEVIYGADISRVYSRRADASQDILRDLEDPSITQVCIIGISLSDFLEGYPAAFHDIWRVIEEYILGERPLPGHDSHLDIKVLILDPNSQGAQLWSQAKIRKEVIQRERLSSDIGHTVDQLIGLEEHAASKSAETHVSFAFRLYRLTPLMFAFCTDSVSYIESYFFGHTVGEPSLMFRYVESTHPQVHHGVQDHFEFIWNDASISSTALLEHHEIGIDREANQSGLINIFDDLTVAKVRMLSLIHNTQKRLYIQGLSLRSFFDGEGELYWAIRRIAEIGEVDIKVLLINPNSEQAIYRSFREYLLENPNAKMSFERFKEDTYKRAQLYRDTERSVRWLRIIASSDTEFRFKWYDTAPYCFMLMVDDSVLVKQYHYGKVGPLVGTKILGKDMAHFEYAREPLDLYDTDTSIRTYQLLESHFNFVFNECAQEIPPTFDFLRDNVTSVGQLERKKEIGMDHTFYQIVLSPNLNITPEEFAAAWNETPEVRAIAEADLSEAEGTQFDAPLIAGILISVGTGVASNLLTDLIKGIIQRLMDEKGARSSQGTPIHKHTHIEQMKKPDGTEMLVVDID